MNGTKLTYLSIGLTYPLMLFVLFWTSSLFEETVPFSFEAFLQPYYGDYGLIAGLFAAIALFDIYWYFKSIFPHAMQNKKQHLLAVIFPEVIAVWGFAIGLIERNPWAALPFFAVSFAIYAYAYLRISEPGQQESDMLQNK